MKAAAKENETKVLYVVPRDRTVQMAENQGKTVIEAYPESDMARCYRSLADKVLEVTAGCEDALKIRFIILHRAMEVGAWFGLVCWRRKVFSFLYVPALAEGMARSEP